MSPEFVFAKKKYEDAKKDEDDDFFSHPDYVSDCSAEAKAVGDKCLQKKLQQQSDQEYFADGDYCFCKFCMCGHYFL